MIFRREPLAEIIAYLRAHAPCTIRVLDPDRGRGRYAGELVDEHVHRPFRVWVDLADRLDLRLKTPRVVGGDGPYVELAFEPLDPEARWDRGDAKYAATAAYQRITKLEDPGFVIDFDEALARTGEPRSVLSLGCNTGDELVLVQARYPAAQITGIDRDASALAVARARFPAATFLEADLGAPLPVGRFDLVVCIGTLQSGNLDDRDLLRRIVQHHAGAVIFGVPNCRYLDGELRSGARVKNFTQPELGLLVKDVAFYRKYLQQHDREVWVTGSHYVLVTARSRGDHATPPPDPAPR